MRALLAALIIAPAVSPPGLQAQLDYNARLGVTWATTLMRDDIVEEVEVRQKLAPTLILGASLPIAPLYRAGLELTLASSGYKADESGSSTDVGTVRTAGLTLGLDGPVSSGLRWRAGAGLLKYWPKDDSGIFAGGGTTRFLAGAGVDYRRPALSNWDLMVSLRYDFHRFTTDALQARGFSQSQGVQRISASVGLARGSR
jgi:preprotein translocase subunit Sec61beta